MNTEIIVLDNGKYKIYVTNLNTITVHRYDEPWKDLTGDNLVYSMFSKIKELEKELKNIKQKNLKKCIYYGDCNFTTIDCEEDTPHFRCRFRKLI